MLSLGVEQQDSPVNIEQLLSALPDEALTRLVELHLRRKR